MRTSLVVCFCVFALQCFQSMLGAPVRGAGRYKAAPASEKSPDLKKRGKAPHPQGSVKEANPSTNTSSTWNRPRCGVPDFPNQKELQYRGRHRQRRFVLHGGRFDKKDLTYNEHVQFCSDLWNLSKTCSLAERAAALMSACFQLRSADASATKKKNPNLHRSLRAKQQIDGAKQEPLRIKNTARATPGTP